MMPVVSDEDQLGGILCVDFLFLPREYELLYQTIQSHLMFESL